MIAMMVPARGGGAAAMRRAACDARVRRIDR